MLTLPLVRSLREQLLENPVMLSNLICSVWCYNLHESCACRLTKKAEPPPTRGVNRDSGTASANGGWLRRLVRQQNIHDSIKPVNRKPTGSNLLAARNRRELLFKTNQPAAANSNQNSPANHRKLRREIRPQNLWRRFAA
jgi:hypothetical protein